MIDLIVSGGASMIFVLLFGLASVGAGVMTFARPSARAEGALRSLSIATTFSSVAGVASCLAAVGYHVTASTEWRASPELHLIVMQGVAESMSPAIVGFGLCALAWVVAAGARRPTSSAAASA